MTGYDGNAFLILSELWEQLFNFMNRPFFAGVSLFNIWFGSILIILSISLISLFRK